MVPIAEAVSTAEYYTVFHGTRQALYIMDVLVHGFKFKISIPTIFCDNNAALSIYKKKIDPGVARHI